MGLDGAIRRQSLPIGIVPDRKYPEPLRRRDLPFEVVADHPHVSWFESQCGKRMPIGAFLRLAEALLAFDLNVIETMLEGEARDLCALRLTRSVGDQRQLNAALLQSVERLAGAGKQRHLLIAQTRESVRNGMSNLARKFNVRRHAGE